MDKKDLPKKVAVLQGGPGSERNVSLATGAGVSQALRSRGIEVVDVDVRDENFQMPNDVDLACHPDLPAKPKRSRRLVTS